MKQLAEAIDGVFETDDDLQTVLAGGLWHHRAKPESAMPYATFHLIAGNTEYTTTDVIEIYTVQFSIFAETMAQVMDAYEQVDDTFNLATLDYDGGQQIIMRRETMIGPTQEETVFMVTTDFQVMRAEALTT